MKAGQVDKLYSKLTPHELAALAFEAIHRRDNAEGELIAGALDKHSGEHWVYRRRVGGLTNLALFYGRIYWQMRFCITVDAGGFITYDHVASMEAALGTVCEQCKVSLEAIRALAGCKGQPTLDKDLFVKPDLVDYYCELFMGIV